MPMGKLKSRLFFCISVKMFLFRSLWVCRLTACLLFIWLGGIVGIFPQNFMGCSNAGLHDKVQRYQRHFCQTTTIFSAKVSPAHPRHRAPPAAPSVAAAKLWLVTRLFF